jgi:hypothetical protein
MTEIEKAEFEKVESALAALEDQRKALVLQRQEDDAEMKRLAYAAHAAGDVEAKRLLTELREAAIRRDQQMREVEAAIATAQRQAGRVQKQKEVA